MSIESIAESLQWLSLKALAYVNRTLTFHFACLFTVLEPRQFTLHTFPQPRHLSCLLSHIPSSMHLSNASLSFERRSAQMFKALVSSRQIPEVPVYKSTADLGFRDVDEILESC